MPQFAAGTSARVAMARYAESLKACNGRLRDDRQTWTDYLATIGAGP